jgi:EmrB/QacA subfamily drug resistance transporter
MTARTKPLAVHRADADPEPNPRRWWILAFLGLAQLMVVLDATIVNIALPSAQDDLGFSDGDRQWIVTAYALAFGSLLLLGGRICDLFGRKRSLIIGLVGFSLASALGGVAQNFEVLVAARALQGVFAALLAPAAMSLLTTTFTNPSERGKAFGIYGAIAGGGGAVGLLLGGVLTEYLSWRWCLYVNLGLAVPAALGAAALLHDRVPATRASLDIPGTLSASAGLVSLVYGFSQAESRGWDDPVTVGCLGIGIALLALFVSLQRNAHEPLLPLRIVLDRNRGGSFLAMGLAGAGIFGVFLFLTFYLQQTLAFSPIETGLAFLPMVVMLILGGATASARLLPRTGPKPLIPTGMLLACGGMLVLTQVGVDSSYAGVVLPGLLLIGLGLGVVFSTAMNSATLAVAEADAGVASAMVNTVQQVGGSIGTALLSTLAATAVGHHIADAKPSASVLAEAAVQGYTTAFWWAAGIFAVGTVACGLLLGSGVPKRAPAARPVLLH